MFRFNEEDDGSLCLRCAKRDEGFASAHRVRCMGKKRPKVWPYKTVTGKAITEPCPEFEQR